MRAVHRWSLACLATALLLLTPYAGRLRPAPDPDVPTADLVTAVRDSAGTPYSGHRRRARAGGPADLRPLHRPRRPLRGRHAAAGLVARRPRLARRQAPRDRRGRPVPPRSRTTEWDYERDEARVTIDPAIRLPRDADLLPPEVARRALDGQTATGRRPAARATDRRGSTPPVCASRSPTRAAASSHVDLWADPETGGRPVRRGVRRLVAARRSARRSRRTRRTVRTPT